MSHTQQRAGGTVPAWKQRAGTATPMACTEIVGFPLDDPTELVRDGDSESHDEPPARAATAPLIEVAAKQSRRAPTYDEPTTTMKRTTRRTAPASMISPVIDDAAEVNW